MKQGEPKQIEPDKSEETAALRAWMDEHIRGLQPWRSTSSYALEFLKTGKANLTAAHARINLQIAFADYYRAIQCLERAALALREIEEIEKIQRVDIFAPTATTAT